MLDAEANQIAYLLDLHCIAIYNGLNCIETQIRKKGSWLLFYGFSWRRISSIPPLQCDRNRWRSHR
ncbi:hypothetical protein BDV28DRAFT_127461 [Aspergillus coremiiformis]|uniref:Uncharacterized protein n=1 Tax=Aspergillus coremiiformis TaxID=138285 RepID=A0A5N6ZFC4_9EURO|nr:hypothetical protein BDV28DRAFT_127461 [Aspergillus coremiiformis]